MVATALPLGTAVLAAVLLGAPGVCPKDVGHIRWDGLEHRVKARGRVWRLTLTVWDRDTDGRPSNGDIVRIDQVRAGGDDTGAGDLWFVARGGLARDLARSYRRAGGRVRARCESRFQVKDVPSLRSGAALGRFLERQVGGGAGRGPSKADQARADMAAWADEWCRAGRNLDQKQLAARLYDRARRRYTGLARGRIRALADEVAGEYALSCARLRGGDFTFD